MISATTLQSTFAHLFPPLSAREEHGPPPVEVLMKTNIQNTGEVFQHANLDESPAARQIKTQKTD